jgi:ADP-ribose pyrophosphatase YjhB (NUDIX family)
MTLPAPAAEGEPHLVRSNGNAWEYTWHSPRAVPDGTPHGANAFCVTADDQVVLISNDAQRWGWPGGRPEAGETWEQTLRREVSEEACAVVRHARLLGFCRAVCLSGPEEGLVLVRSMWRADVELLAWEPRFEIRHRSVVPARDLLMHLSMEEGFEPLYHRVIIEAGLLPDLDGRAATPR